MEEIINSLRAENNLRSLCDVKTIQKYIINDNKQYLNLSSNDYLGLSSANLQFQFIEKVDFSSNFLMSNPSSRLMTGNTIYYKSLENKLAKLYNKEESLVLSSGFMLNSGALPALTIPDDYIIADKLVHASIIDGIRMCSCGFTRFHHNDVENLERILSKTVCKGTIYVALESVYSMDGDTAPLQEIVELKKKYNFKIYLDEAHAFGVVGETGLGLAERLELIDQIDYIVVTMGKATASQGAFIVLDRLSKDILVNRMRTLIFSTALPPISLMWSEFIIDRLESFKDKRNHLNELSTMLSQAVTRITSKATPNSHIIPILVGDNGKCIELAEKLRERGYWVTAIRYPTVAKGSARLRISLTAALSKEDIAGFISELEREILTTI